MSEELPLLHDPFVLCEGHLLWQPDDDDDELP
jgi:hypothetical protein